MSGRSGKELRDEAIERVGEAAPVLWMDNAAAAIRWLAMRGERFTTDDVWAMIEHPPEPRAMGAAMVSARRAGIIVPLNETRNSRRPACHSRPLRLWLGA